MTRNRFLFVLTLLICALVVSLPAQTFQGVLTWHNDIGRTGQNLSETILTPKNVNMGTFGKVFSYAVDGQIFAQPLYVPNVTIPGQGTHNVVYVATENDSLYAFDADGLTSTALWQDSFINPANGITPITCGSLTKCSIYPIIGITATPVIDPSSGTIYVLVRTDENGTLVERLHALDITTGTEKFGGPVQITGSVPGTGCGSVGGMIPFENFGMQRTGLLLLNGVVYLGWATGCHGWIMGYNAQTLAQTAILNTTPNGVLGGVWQSGAGLSADSNGYLYVATGDGLFDFYTGGPDDGDSVLKMDANLNILDYFTPMDQACRKANDYDLGSGGPMVVPTQTGPYPDLLIQAGKGGAPCDSTDFAPIYLMDRDSLGHYNSAQDANLQTINGAPHGYWSSPAYWQGPTGTYIYLSGVDEAGGKGDYLKMYSLISGQLSTAPVAQSYNILMTGSTPAISANGSSDGILWAIVRMDPLGELPGSHHAVLFAYNANDVAKTLYSSSQAGTRDEAGLGSKFVAPTIANGRVYVGTQTELDVYGLLP